MTLLFIGSPPMYHTINKSALTLHAKFVVGPMRDMGRLDMEETQATMLFIVLLGLEFGFYLMLWHLT
jgi:hypothetical protein